MITGHLGIAGAVYSGRRDSSLVWLLGASMAPDVVDALFVVAGSCNPSGLYSHTFPAAVLIAAVTGAIAYFATGQRVTGVLAAVLVLAHLPPDYVTGRKLFWPGGELLGLRLYDHPLADFAVEALIAAGGWWLVRSRRWAPRWATGWLALAVLLLFQGALDVVGARRGGVKPNACASAAPLATG
ncbi:MAG: hypothetical protein ACJ79A_19735 [Gemmatimonadaceae bacterium]